MDNIQEECSVRFNISFHAHCAYMQRVYQNLGTILTRTISEVASINLFIRDIFHLDARPWNEFEFAWQFTTWLLSIEKKGMKNTWVASYQFTVRRNFYIQIQSK